jgi:hypothetical protein
MGLVSGPNKADDICGKTTVMGTMQRGSTVLEVLLQYFYYAFDHSSSTRLNNME